MPHGRHVSKQNKAEIVPILISPVSTVTTSSISGSEVPFEHKSLIACSPCDQLVDNDCISGLWACCWPPRLCQLEMRLPFKRCMLRLVLPFLPDCFCPCKEAWWVITSTASYFTTVYVLFDDLSMVEECSAIPFHPLGSSSRFNDLLALRGPVAPKGPGYKSDRERIFSVHVIGHRLGWGQPYHIIPTVA